MAGLNKVILIGNLGRDPELRYTANGQPVANFTLATTESWTNKSGEREQRTEWHRIVTWGRLAEICGEHLNKGKQVYVEGRLQTREWEDREGNKRKTTEVTANQVLMLGRRGDGPGGPSSPPDAPEDSPPDSPPDSTPGGSDDIPF
ncbi:MAG: single-stranded DNA-binding protein [Myxococcota bacterium]